MTSLGRSNTGSDALETDKADEAVRRTMHSGLVDTATNTSDRTEVTSLAERMCYACLTAFSNGASGLRKKGDDPDGERFEVELPYWVTRRVRDGVRREVMATGEMKRDEMKAVVGEFLLDDDNEEGDM